MYAVFKLGGNQHRATVGDVLKVQKVTGEVGQSLEISEVLLVKKDEAAVVGTPFVAGAKVVAEILAQGREKTMIIQKFKRRVKYRRRNGHRQPYTRIRITGVMVP
ncbi:MAG: 50S ribosomal protein L21 [Deltaproteobacteria bacterium]|nr:50S ribosomal protein L21 [Deltaproteobacteria bacterium]